MATPPTFILAEGETEKLVGFLVVAVVWGGFALASWIKKATTSGIKLPPAKSVPPSRRAQPPKLKLAAKQQYRPNAAPQNAYPPSIIQRAQTMASYATRQQAQRKSVRKPPRLPPPLPAVSGRVVAAQRLTPAPGPAPAPAPAIQAVVRRQSPGIVAGAAVMGLKPNDLRQQIVLAEILQPPLALR